MAEFRPFRGIRFHEDPARDISRLICPPYDVISPEQQQFFYDLDPHNAIRLDFARALPGDDGNNNRYLRAATDFREWMSRGILVQDPDPGYYLLEERFEDEQGRSRVRCGIVGLKRLEENRPGASIRPHEATYAGPKQDRFLLMKATASNFSPIFAVYQDDSFTLEKIFEQGPPDGRMVEATGQDGVRRRLFVLRDPERMERIGTFLGERPLLIADGHHRYETSLAYRDWRRAQETGTGDAAPYDYTMMYITNMDSPGLCVYPAHRILRTFPGMDPETFLRALGDVFSVERMGASGEAGCRDRFVRELRDVPAGGLKIGCKFKDPDLFCILSVADTNRLSALFSPDTHPLVQSLDVSVLHEIVLGRTLGISREDQAREERILYAKGEGPALELLERGPDLWAAFFLNPAPVTKIMQIAFEGILLPQKTTYFFPKVMTGFVFRSM
jgi:uncharacterized protein (DUF1015 family)